MLNNKHTELSTLLPRHLCETFGTLPENLVYSPFKKLGLAFASGFQQHHGR